MWRLTGFADMPLLSFLTAGPEDNVITLLFLWRRGKEKLTMAAEQSCPVWLEMKLSISSRNAINAMVIYTINT